MSLAVRRYSEALLDIAFEEKCEDEVYEQFKVFYGEMKAEKDFERLMTEKILSSEELKATVSKILEGGNTYLISFLMTLIDRNRMDEVMEMFLDFERGYKEKKNILEAEAVTAIEMTEDQIEQVKKELGEKYGKTIVLKTSVDPSIIGGMVLYVGNEMLDAQAEAFAIFTQIQDAYAEFDREKLEELMPQMDTRLNYLSKDALNSYYMILEYVEMPSNG